MKSVINTLCSAVILSLFVLSCKQTMPPKKIKITIRSGTQHNADVKISREIYLDEVVLGKSKTDSSGFCSIEVEVHKPCFAAVQIGRKYAELYLSPGDSLVIAEHNPAYTEPLIFSGKGKEANNYIGWINSTTEKIKWSKGKGIIDLSIKEFIHRRDSLKMVIQNFHHSYIDSVHLPDPIISLFQYKNKIRMLEVEQEYKFYRKNNMNNQRWEAEKTGQPYQEDEVAKELEYLAKDLPFDTTLLVDGFSDYEVLLTMYWQSEINLVASRQIGPKGNYNEAPLITNALIKRNNYPAQIREFLQALNLRYEITGFGITRETDSVFNDFKRAYGQSKYLPVLNRNREEWLPVAPGNPAPDFDAYTLEGKKVSLKDLQGKILFIDVWATWCAPCVAEIPFSKKLHKEFAGEDGIKFLNLSVDRDKEAWQKFVKKESDWKGLHLTIETERLNDFYKRYKLFGIPAFILIDKAGKIITLRASRPSDDKVKTEIRQALVKR